MKDLSVRPQTIKIVEKNRQQNLRHCLQQYFIGYISPDKGNKRKKVNKWDYIKLKRFYTANKNINKIKRYPTEWENIFADISNKGLKTKVYKELTKLSTKKPPNKPNSKMGKGPEQTLLQRGHTDAQCH